MAFTILELIGNLGLLLPKIPNDVTPGLQVVIDIGSVTRLWLPALGHGLVSQQGFCLLSWLHAVEHGGDGEHFCLGSALKKS